MTIDPMEKLLYVLLAVALVFAFGVVGNIDYADALNQEASAKVERARVAARQPPARFEKRWVCEKIAPERVHCELKMAEVIK